MAFTTERWIFPNILPVAFVVWVMGTLWYMYLDAHLLFLLQPGQDDIMWSRGRWQACVSQTLTVMLVICFLRAVLADPGSVPDTPAWKRGSSSGDVLEDPDERQHELKSDGQRRFCKWCDNFKPDRCHHCRVCRSCILRMDHHCPWIANCVGFHNHKYFFLLVLYGLLNVIFIVATMSETMHRVMTDECTTKKRFLVIFSMTMAVIMLVLLTVFFAFHVHLMLKAITTIEFCEKQAKMGTCPSYDAGTMRNIQAVLGSNVLLWFLPAGAPEGDGTKFMLQSAGTCIMDAFLLDSVSPTSGFHSDAPEVTGRSAAKA